ncbi:hypothetical protein F2Q69_00059566 [Brassica cretica]|uniref:Uncharacterized protein n=1 Tax=Brassica cretica TaxID=69181 RepID=A0A8S9RCA4_BRACR|nr:hypothetical protein F2Q69_00059566 [Brassica cretica]
MPLRSVGTGGYLRSSRKGFGPGFGQGVKATMNQTRPDSWYQWLLSICADSFPDNNARMIRDKESYADGQAIIKLGRANSDSDRGFSLLARLARTACTGDRADDLASLFDPIMDFSFGYFSKARILKLSEDLGDAGMQLVRSERPAAFAERPAALGHRPSHVLILSALDTASSDESGQEPNVNTSSNRWTCESYQAKTRDPALGGLADGQAIIKLGRANSDSDRGFSLLARLAHTACTGDRADDLASLFDPIMDFSFGYFSKARILKLSEDLGDAGMQLVRSERPAAFAERPAALGHRPSHVLILSALDTSSSDESGQEPKSS